MLDNEYIQSLQRAPSRVQQEEPKKNDRGFVIKNAPWDNNGAAAPDTSSTSEFPSFPGATGSAVAPKASHVWGPSRRF